MLLCQQYHASSNRTMMLIEPNFNRLTTE